MKFIFCMQMNIKLLRPVILLGMARPAQITQKDKFAKSLKYLEKEVSDEVDFFMQISITVFS